MMARIIRLLGYVLCCLLFLYGIAVMVMGFKGEPTGRFSADYAPGATANAVEKMENVSSVVFGAAMTLCAAMALIAREIVVAINALKQEVIDSRPAAPRRTSFPKPQPLPLPDVPPPMQHVEPTARSLSDRPLGQRPGESLEAWAKRIEDAEMAAFKARTKD